MSDASERDFDAYLVDLDGTLYAPGPLKWMMAAEMALLGLHRAKIVQAFRREHERLRVEGHEPVESPYQLQLENTARALHTSTHKVENVVTEWMQERPAKWIKLCARTELLEELRAFKATGGRLALVSDYPATRKLAALPAAPDFDAIIANGEPGGPRRLKPDPDGYLRAAAALKLMPERCLVIGDRDDADGKAAESAGMAFRRVG